VVEEALLLFISAPGLVPIPKASAFVTCINVGILSNPNLEEPWWTVPKAKASLLAMLKYVHQQYSYDPEAIGPVYYAPFSI